MEVSIILLSLLVAFGNSILLKGPSRPAVPVAGNMQKFLDLLLDEKHSRLLLEQEFNNLKAGFEAQNITLTQQIISKEKDIEQISLTLDTEMSNRRQLESAYTRLSEEFRNLTMEHSEEMRRNTDLKANLRNLSIALNFLRQENADLKRKQGKKISNFNLRHIFSGKLGIIISKLYLRCHDFGHNSPRLIMDMVIDRDESGIFKKQNLLTHHEI